MKTSVTFVVMALCTLSLFSGASALFSEPRSLQCTTCKATVSTALAAMKTPAIMNKVLGALDTHCIPVANYTESICAVVLNDSYVGFVNAVLGFLQSPEIEGAFLADADNTLCKLLPPMFYKICCQDFADLYQSLVDEVSSVLLQPAAQQRFVESLKVVCYDPVITVCETVIKDIYDDISNLSSEGVCEFTGKCPKPTPSPTPSPKAASKISLPSGSPLSGLLSSLTPAERLVATLLASLAHGA